LLYCLIAHQNFLALHHTPGELAYLAGFVPLVVYTDGVVPFLGQDSFATLMLTSCYCAAGLFYVYARLQRLFCRD
jgi:hypothetical protein